MVLRCSFPLLRSCDDFKSCFPRPRFMGSLSVFDCGFAAQCAGGHGGGQQALQDLADKTWTHPVNGGPIQYSAKLHRTLGPTPPAARQDPVRVLRPEHSRDFAANLAPRSRSSSCWPNIGLTSTGATSCTTTTWPPGSRLIRRTGPCGPIHGAAVHAGSRLAPQAAVGGQGPSRDGTCGPAARRRGSAATRRSTSARCGIWTSTGSLPVLLPNAASGSDPLALDSRRLLAAGLPSAVDTCPDRAEDLVREVQQAVQKRGLPSPR